MTTTTLSESTRRAAIEAEVARACADAFANNTPVDVHYDSSWMDLESAESLRKVADACLTKDRTDKAEADKRAQEALNNAPPVNVDQIVKNPDALIGQVWTLFASITQFDAATGICQFRGEWDAVDHADNFSWAGSNAYFTSGDGASTCPLLSAVTQHEVVQLWVKGAGSFSYNTQTGGNTTVPKFEVLKVSILRHT